MFNIILLLLLCKIWTAALDEERTSPVNSSLDSSKGGSGSGGTGSGTAGGSSGNNHSSSTLEKNEPLTAKQRYQIKHRELFLSRQVETIPAMHIRGRCSVTLLNETESLQSYLNKDVSCKFQTIPIDFNVYILNLFFHQFSINK